MQSSDDSRSCREEDPKSAEGPGILVFRISRGLMDFIQRKSAHINGTVFLTNSRVITAVCMQVCQQWKQAHVHQTGWYGKERVATSLLSNLLYPTDLCPRNGQSAAGADAQPDDARQGHIHDGALQWVSAGAILCAWRGIPTTTMRAPVQEKTDMQRYPRPLN